MVASPAITAPMPLSIIGLAHSSMGQDRLLLLPIHARQALCPTIRPAYQWIVRPKSLTRGSSLVRPSYPVRRILTVCWRITLLHGVGVCSKLMALEFALLIAAMIKSLLGFGMIAGPAIPSLM